MTYPRKFFLNLTSNTISLGIKEGKEQNILDSFDPNEPAASEGLKKLFNLAKSLNLNIPKIEINLPENLLQNETLITNKTISKNEAIELITKRKTIDVNGIMPFAIESIGTRATCITYIQVSLINEVKEFVEKAGFSIKRFNIGKFSFENNNKFKLKFKINLIDFKFLNLQKFSKPILTSLALLLIGLVSFLYISEEKTTYVEPLVQAKIKIDNKNQNNINQNLKINLNNDLISTSQRINTFQEINRLNTNSKSDKIINFIKSNSIRTDIIPKQNVIISKDILFRNDLSYKKLKTKIFNIAEIKSNKNIKLPEFSTLEDVIDFESLFTNLFHENNHNLENKVIPDFKNILAYNKVKNKNLNKVTNKEFKENLDDKTNENYNIAINKVDEIKEIYPELDPSYIEYAIKILPYKKPSIIDTIRILSEPTLSSGALVFITNPKERPNYFKNFKIVKPSQIKIAAKATRSPSIPEKASVGYNSTKRNFIDLDRTNLIGIIGKSSNPRALLRLSNGKIIKLKVGQWFEGWRVFAIDSDKIHVENGFKQEILRMPG